MFQMFLQMPPLEALCAISIFGIPMLAAVIILSAIKRRRNRGRESGPSVWSIPPQRQAIVGVMLFAVAAIYYLVTNEVELGRQQDLNLFFALPYVFLGRDLGTLTFVAAGILFLVLSLVRSIRNREIYL
jgi:hypothetical protein